MAQSSRITSCLFPGLLLGIALGCAGNAVKEQPDTEDRTKVEPGVRMTDDAQKSIGIVTSPVESREIQATLDTTGWLLVSPGREVTLKAPITGFVIPQPQEDTFSLGSLVTRGQCLAALRVFLSPQETAQLVAMKEDVDILVRQSKATLEAAEARYQRVQQLSEGGALPAKEREFAREAMDRARAAYEEAQQQLPFLPSEPYEDSLQLRSVAVNSPQAGHVAEVYVRTGQFVMQGDPLWKISDWSSLWLRVPVFEGDLPQFDRTASVRMAVPGRESLLPARPIGIPQPTQDGRRTADLFYEVANADGTLRPGQAVAVSLPIGALAEQILVPQSAVLWDGMGDAWVYVVDGGNHFRRQRVELGQSHGHLTVVIDGLVQGQSIVTAGAEALFGEQFQGKIQALDDDD